MSSSGVPSMMSMFSTCRVFPSTLVSFTMEMPIGFGLPGARVANTPWGLLSM